MKLTELSLADLLALKQLLQIKYDALMLDGRWADADTISDTKLMAVNAEISNRLLQIQY